MPYHESQALRYQQKDRLALNRSQDHIYAEAELQKFTAEVTDPPYGGPHPAPRERTARRHPPALVGPTHGPGEDGAEDVSSRTSGKGTLIGTFIADQKHGFFESETFTSVLRAVQAQPRKFKVYEKAGTLRISVQDVKNIHAAKEAMESVVGVMV